jgi:hypothetical protein
MANELPKDWKRGTGEYEGQLWNGKKWVADPRFENNEAGQQQAVTAKGANGQISFVGKVLIISRKGAAARLTVGKGERRIPLSAIQAIQWKPLGSLVSGFISFTIAGSLDRNVGFGRATWNAVDDENAVVFKNKKQEAEMIQLRDAVQQALAERQT